jgi:hypothetical protein
MPCIDVEALPFSKLWKKKEGRRPRAAANLPSQRGEDILKPNPPDIPSRNRTATKQYSQTRTLGKAIGGDR